jgi:hypothetical protein
MAKSRKQMHKKRKGRRAKKVMRGGDFSEEQKTVLQNSGFYPGQIERFQLMGLTFAQVNQKIQEITGDNYHGNSDDLVEAVEQALDEEHMNQGMPPPAQDVANHNMDIYNDDAGQMNMNELDMDIDQEGTDNEADSDDDMNGGRKKRRTMKKRKKRKTRKLGRKNGRKTSRKSRKQRGGVCYGNGVGANNYDPNFSIYNTRELELFPYRPTN